MKPSKLFFVVVVISFFLISVVVESNDDERICVSPGSHGGILAHQDPASSIPVQDATTPYEQTDYDLVEIMMDFAEIQDSRKNAKITNNNKQKKKKATIVFDLGCGDGRLSIAAARRGAKKVIGIERRYDLLAEAKYNYEQEKKKNKKKEHFHDVVEFRAADIFQCDFVGEIKRLSEIIKKEDSTIEEVDVAVVCYFYVQKIDKKIFDSLPPGSRFVSHDYAANESLYQESYVLDTERENKKIIHNSTRAVIIGYYVGNNKNSFVPKKIGPFSAVQNTNNKEKQQQQQFDLDFDMNQEEKNIDEGISVIDIRKRILGTKIKNVKYRYHRMHQLPSSSSTTIFENKKFQFAIVLIEQKGFLKMIWLRPYSGTSIRALQDSNLKGWDNIPPFEIRVTGLKRRKSRKQEQQEQEQEQKEEGEEIVAEYLPWTKSRSQQEINEMHKKHPTVRIFPSVWNFKDVLPRLPVILKVETRIDESRLPKKDDADL